MSSFPTSMQQQPTQAQLREQNRASVQDEQTQATIAKMLREMQGDLQTTTRVERVVTPVIPPHPPLPAIARTPQTAQGQGGSVGGIGGGSGSGGPGGITIRTGGGGHVEDIPPGAQEVAIVFFVIMAVIIIGLPIARAIGRLIDRRFAPSAVRAPDMEPQLRRIEQAVEAMSIEIERISESQRYLTKAEAARRDEAAILPRQP